MNLMETINGFSTLNWIAIGLAALFAIGLLALALRSRMRKIEKDAKRLIESKYIDKPAIIMPKYQIDNGLTNEERQILTAKPSNDVDDKVQELKEAIKEQVKKEIMDKIFK